MNQNFELLNNEDVVSLTQISEAQFGAGKTFKILQMINEYKQYIYRTKGVNNHNAKMFDESISCEVLKQDNQCQGWRSGKIKFVVQFEPDAIEDDIVSNPLDDIRQQLDTTS